MTDQLQVVKKNFFLNIQTLIQADLCLKMEKFGSN